MLKLGSGAVAERHWGRLPIVHGETRKRLNRGGWRENPPLSLSPALSLLTLMLTATDPLFTLQKSISSAVTGVCFLRYRQKIVTEDDKCEEGSDSDESSDCNFQCSNMLLGPQHDHLNPAAAAAVHSSAASHASLQGYALASCHHDGSCKIWDLSSRRCVVENINMCRDRKFGLTVRRLATSTFLYQTRDVNGTVTLHDLHQPDVEVMKIETKSTTFCTLSPCRVDTLNKQSESSTIDEESNLVALPTELHSMALVRDLRCDPTTQPAFRVHVGQDGNSTNQYNHFGRDNKYGMLMSLALSLQHDTKKLVLGCGMEDGSVLFYDLGATGKGRSPWLVQEPSVDINSEGNLSKYTCSSKLGKEPVLSLDIVTSYGHNENHEANPSSSLVAVAGCAGDPDEMCDLPKQEQGTITTMKISLAHDTVSDSTMKSSKRRRTQTCAFSSGGKVGVSIARFRPDGRVFAVGGWDKRLRVFGRTSSKPLAVLHGEHVDSVSAMDWADDSAISGLLATGAGDGKVCVYRVLPHTLREHV